MKITSLKLTRAQSLLPLLSVCTNLVGTGMKIVKILIFHKMLGLSGIFQLYLEEVQYSKNG